MKILVIEPEKAPYEKEIGDDIHDMQAQNRQEMCLIRLF